MCHLASLPHINEIKKTTNWKVGNKSSNLKNFNLPVTALQVSYSGSGWCSEVLVFWASCLHQKNCRSDLNSFWLIQHDKSNYRNLKHLFISENCKVVHKIPNDAVKRRSMSLSCMKQLAVSLAFSWTLPL